MKQAPNMHALRLSFLFCYYPDRPIKVTFSAVKLTKFIDALTLARLSINLLPFDSLPVDILFIVVEPLHRVYYCGRLNVNKNN